MIQPAYIGYPNQQSSVIQKLTYEAKRNPSGIFVVGGAGRVGKNTTVEHIARNLNLEGSDYNEVSPHVNMNDEIPQDYFYKWDDAYREGSRDFVFGEIPVNFTSAFDYVDRFYQNAKQDGNDIRILFNVISRNHPAWENEDVESDILDGLSTSFSRDLNVEFLSSDRERIVEEMWRFRNEDMYYHILANQIGFRSSVPMIADTQDYKKFKVYLEDQMEGNISRTESW